MSCPLPSELLHSSFLFSSFLSYFLFPFYHSIWLYYSVFISSNKWHSLYQFYQFVFESSYLIESNESYLIFLIWNLDPRSRQEYEKLNSTGAATRPRSASAGRPVVGSAHRPLSAYAGRRWDELNQTSPATLGYYKNRNYFILTNIVVILLRYLSAATEEEVTSINQTKIFCQKESKDIDIDYYMLIFDFFPYHLEKNYI